MTMEILERKPGADLKFAARRHRHGDGPELRSVDEAVRCAEVGLVQRVESFGAELEVGSFRETKGTLPGRGPGFACPDRRRNFGPTLP